MALFSVGGDIPKMEITSYSDINFGTKIDTIKLPLISLEGGLSQTYKIKWTEVQGIGASAPIVTYEKYEFANSSLKFDVIVDATGVFKPSKLDMHMDLINYDKPNVEPYVTKLKDLLYGFGEEEHRPPYLKLTWAKVLSNASTKASGTTAGVYNGVLEEMEVNYELFSVEGNPVRAKISLTIKACVAPKEAPGQNSPDLTHIIEVKHGDNLTKLSQNIYDSPEYAHQIARVNGLASVFALRPGMKLLFPPLDKMDKVN